MHKRLVSITVALAVSIANPAASAASGSDALIPYMDAHSHLVLPNATPDAEIALFKRAGIAAVVIMHSDPEVLQAVAKQYPGYVIPFISIARTPDMPGLRLSNDTAAIFAKLHDAGAVCGFGEMPTRLEPKTDPSDDVALLNPMRMKIYDLADVNGMPVNIHVSLDTPAVVNAFGRIAATHPHMSLILAHAGWTAEPTVIKKLLTAHSNIYVDLSVRLDPRNGFGTPTTAPPTGPNQFSILTADGWLQPEWRSLLERFPHRFLFAMDVTATGTAGREEHIGQLLAGSRKALGVLPRETHEAIAHGNLQRLLHGCGTSKSRKTAIPQQDNPSY